MEEPVSLSPAPILARNPSSEPESSARPGALQEARYALGAGVGYLLLFQLTRRLPFNEKIILLATLISLGLVLVFTVRVARSLLSNRTLAWNVVLSAACSLPLILLPIAATLLPGLMPLWIAVSKGLRLYTGFLRLLPGLHGLLLIWFAACMGTLLSRLVRETKMLLPMAVALACVDLYVVFGGGLVTQAQDTHHPNALAQTAMHALTISLPTTHPKAGSAPLQLSVGFADFLFIALFFACFVRFGIPARRTFQVLCATLAAYMLIVYFTNIALPALVPIAIVVIGMNLSQFHYQRSEAFALLYAGLIVGAVMGGLFFYSHRNGPAPTFVPRAAPKPFVKGTAPPNHAPSPAPN